MKRYIYILFIIGIVIIIKSCKKDDPISIPEVPPSSYEPTPYNLTIPQGFPDMQIHPDNPLTVEGVQLGRMLYYDSLLHPTQSMACAGCHFQSNSFSSALDNCLPHVNLGWNDAFLRNGKVEGWLEDIMQFEVEDFFVTNISKFNSHSTYPALFKNAFGTDNITSKEAAYALAQFFRIMISSDSKWDKYLKGEATLTQAEAKGYEIFFSEKGDCFHCHGTILFTDDLFHNNGLDSLPAQGRAEISGDPNDYGKYKSPTLRNIEFTAPYMHDARFNTLEEVIDFYSTDVRYSQTVDPLMKKVHLGGLQLTLQEKSDLLAFLKTLSDTSYLSNPDLSNPF